MKEIVDRILNGEAVDIAREDADYCLSVSQDGDKYKVGFINKRNMADYCPYLTAKTMKDAGNLLIELADELESRKKFRNDERIYYVQTDGNVGYFDYFVNTNSFHLSLIVMGNAFKTKAEAHDNIPVVMAKYQELRDKGLV